MEIDAEQIAENLRAADCGSRRGKKILDLK